MSAHRCIRRASTLKAEDHLGGHVRMQCERECPQYCQLLCKAQLVDMVAYHGSMTTLVPGRQFLLRVFPYAEGHPVHLFVLQHGHVCGESMMNLAYCLPVITKGVNAPLLLPMDALTILASRDAGGHPVRAAGGQHEHGGARPHDQRLHQRAGRHRVSDVPQGRRRCPQPHRRLPCHAYGPLVCLLLHVKGLRRFSLPKRCIKCLLVMLVDPW